MSTQSDLNSVNPIEAALQAILRRLDNLDEKLQPLQPLQEKVAMLEESGNCDCISKSPPWAHFLAARSTGDSNSRSCNDHSVISPSIVYRISEHQSSD
ncbi:hypothetical protein GUJ93_ZPchr0007g5515 [Zizania palustris]|uniref:Uncharacterized protein n=1 Tax=Zizania palustris TaxID=103762 RepID=A0A8J5W0K2_ZIZPA|nr:hypothetical protein GUJ93_ZPchr0005g14814 [Zizania palustris]KAG8080520.1 hypothetical protein GUJ93_ZPchr0007g5515 [Zizania palustris]